MISINFKHVCLSNEFHFSWTLSHSSSIPLGVGSYLKSSYFSCFQRSSIGFESGDRAEQSIKLILRFSKQFVAFFEVCFNNIPVTINLDR